MKTYTILVTEVRHVTVEYTVTARNRAEALEAAERGETDAEAERGTPDVHDRQVRPDTLELQH